MKSPMDAVVRRLQRTDAMLVQEPGRSYVLGVLLLDLALFVIAVGAWATLPLWHGWWRIIAAVIIGLQLGRAGIVAFRRAGAYRTGWLRGRSQMIASMVECQNRGMAPSEWLAGELSRDFAVLGLTAEEVQQHLHPPQPEE